MWQRPIPLLLALLVVVAACGDDSTGSAGSAVTASTVAATASDRTDDTEASTTVAPVDGEPTSMWVTDFPGGRLATIDLGNSTCTLSDVGVSAEYLAFGLGAIWITDGMGQQLIGVDPASGEVFGRRDVGGWPSDIALSDTSIWLAIPDTNSVLEIDPATGDIIDETTFDANPSVVAVGSSAVGTWDGPLYYEDRSEGVEWERDMGGTVTDTQFYGGNLWALVWPFGGGGHFAGGTEIWVIDPATNQAELFAALDDTLQGILVDDLGVWANSPDQGEMAWWDEPMPSLAPSRREPRWVRGDSPTNWRPGGTDIFTVHQQTGRATQVDRGAVGGDWGTTRGTGVPPLVWDEPGTSYYDIRDMCAAPKFGPADIAAATDSSYETATATTPSPWDSDPAPTGMVGPTAAFFSSCTTTVSGEGPISARGVIDNAEEDAVVTLRVIDPDGTAYVLDSTPLDSDGAFAFDEMTPPITAPYTIRLSIDGATCETPVE